MADTATLQLKVDSRQVDQAAAELDDLSAAGNRAQASVTGVGTAAKQAAPKISTAATAANNAGRKMSTFQQRAGQVGFQVQDLAVQLQSGTSAFVAFGQQGSQLAGAFGPGGAIIGAFIAVGAAIGGVLVASLANAGDAVEKLIDQIRDGTEELDKLGDAQRRVFRREQLILIDETTSKVQSYDEKIAEAEATLNRFQNATAGMGVSQFLLDREIDKSTRTLDDLNAGRESEVQTLNRQKQLLKDVAEGTSEEARAIDKRNKARARTAFEAVAATGQSAASQAIKEFEARKKVIDKAENDRVATELEVSLARTTNARVLQEELTAIEKAGVDQRQKLVTSSINAQLGASSQLFGNLANIAKAGGKKQFDNYKALASAQAGLSAAQATLNALATPGIPFPLAVALAGSAAALGAVQVGQIQAQEYQPRALGGQMKSGGSFLVGERGPELVTMGNKNANIQSAGSFGGAEPVQVNNVFNISPGLSGAVSAEIAKFIPTFQQVAVQSVNQAMRKGSTTSRLVRAR